MKIAGMPWQLFVGATVACMLSLALFTRLNPSPFSKLTPEQKADATAMHERIAYDVEQGRKIVEKLKANKQMWFNSQVEAYANDAIPLQDALKRKYGIDEDHWNSGGK
jgi:hypothetical protein